MGNKKSRYFQVDGLELHYSEWGEQHSETVVCCHGLTRNGRDFDLIAQALSKHYRVICPDMIGRGLSQWSPNPVRDYRYERYAHHIVTLLDQLGIENVRWIGTSMGGAIGIHLAGGRLQQRVSHLVLNDIGAGPVAAVGSETAVPDDAIQRIVTYVANPPEFATLTELVQYYRTIYAPFGITSEQEWLAFTEHSARRKENGMFTPDHDPQIAKQFDFPEDLQLWDQWDAIKSKVLLIRGEHSDVLPVETAMEMQKRGPGCEWITIPDCGHAPALNTKEQITLIENFFC